ncbi:hypothetical protein MNBD_GAMMA06-2023 [hydrothermal vent metagenome]|uniref:DUF1330 domain-containing protein n=1 Tax=hydrothermal vent metagenome TaxID=652676 RepID=A0A3B0XB94_9ZZZZ
MSTLIIVDLSITDKEKLNTYSALAAETLVPFGGEFIAKGAIEALHGEAQFQTKVVIQFPDRESATNWYASSAYQKIISIRNQAMSSQFHLVS